MLKDLLHVIRPLGILLMAFSAAFLPPIGVSLYFDEGALPPFLAGAATNFAVGFLMWGVGRRHRRELKSRDGFLLVALIWVMVAATATVPLILGLGMSFTDAEQPGDLVHRERQPLVHRVPRSVRRCLAHR